MTAPGTPAGPGAPGDPSWTAVGARFAELVELPAAEREARLAELAATDTALAAELASLLAADAGAAALPERAAIPTTVAGGLASAEPMDALAPRTRVGPYRILGELARGGMGVVYRAERADGAFERQVAIKVARPDLVSPALGGRFAEERRILGTLDHPGIARLLDAGTTADGRLFLVLDLVEGQRLDSWAEGQSLASRLSLFLAICEAVEHAHRRLVLHRDLKPANVMVTASGEPKLLDFGIARLLGEDAEPGVLTRLGGRLLTPEYASPEQLRGEPLGTASDVYALGVILYELLTGRRPHELTAASSPEERARRITSAPRPLPSSALRAAGDHAPLPARLVAGDLDAIVGQALAPEPAERYGSVAALADDLRRHLAGRPIVARPPSLAERTWKAVRRHRVAVATATAFVAVLTGAALYSAREARVATRERDRAERRFSDVRELARVFLFDLPDRIEHLPGSTGARQMLVTTGLAYLDRLHAETSADGGATASLDVGFLSELAAGYERLGEVQSGLYAANVGKTAAAVGTLDQAVALREQLATLPGAGPEARRQLANARLLRARARFKAGQAAAGLEDAQAAATLVDAHDRSRERDAEGSRLVARVLTFRGFLEGATGNLDAAIASLRQAIAIFDGIGAAQAADPAPRRERIEALANLGTMVGQRPEGLPEVDRLYTAVLTAQREIWAGALQDPLGRRGLLSALFRLSIVRQIQGRTEESLALSAEALTFAEELATADPDNFEAHRNLAQLRARRGATLSAAGRFSEATALARTAIADLEQLLGRDLANVTVEVLVAEARQTLGESLLGAARHGGGGSSWRAAREELTRALAIYERLIGSGVLAKGLTEAAQAAELRTLIAECDRTVGARPTAVESP